MFPNLKDQDKNLKNTDLVLSLAQYKNLTKPITDSNPSQSLWVHSTSQRCTLPYGATQIVVIFQGQHSCYL